MLYVAPVLTLIGVCDRQPEREDECLEKLRRHVSLFSGWSITAGGKAVNADEHSVNGDQKTARCQDAALTVEHAVMRCTFLKRGKTMKKP